MAEIKGPPAELRLTIEIKRAATGMVEKYDVVGHVTPDQAAEGQRSSLDGDDPQHSGA